MGIHLARLSSSQLGTVRSKPRPRISCRLSVNRQPQTGLAVRMDRSLSRCGRPSFAYSPRRIPRTDPSCVQPSPPWLDFWENRMQAPFGSEAMSDWTWSFMPAIHHPLPLQGSNVGCVSDCARHGVGSLRLHDRERSNPVVFRTSRKGKSDLGPRSAGEILGS